MALLVAMVSVLSEVRVGEAECQWGLADSWRVAEGGVEGDGDGYGYGSEW